MHAAILLLAAGLLPTGARNAGQRVHTGQRSTPYASL